MTGDRIRRGAPIRRTWGPAGSILAAALALAACRASRPIPTIATDKPDYPPGHTVTFTGHGWAPGEAVTIVLQREPRVHADEVLSAVADGSGRIRNADFAPAPHDLGVRFGVTATGGRSGMRARTTFTDAALTWTGTVSTDWNTGGNWSSGSVPGSGDDITIPANVASGRYPVVSTAASAKKLTLASGGGTQPSLTVSASTLTVGDNFSINAGTVTHSGGTIALTGGALSVTGTLNESGGTFLGAVTLTVNSGGNVNVSGTGIVHMANALGTNPTDNIVIVAGGTITQSGGSVDTKDLTTDTGTPAGTYSQSGGTFKLYHDFRNDGTFTSTGGTIEFAGTGGGNAFNAPGTNQFFNLVVNTGVSTDFSSNLAASILIRGDWTMNGTADLTGQATTVTFNGTGSQTIGGAAGTTFRNVVVNKASGTVTLDRNQTVANGNLSVTAGTLDLASSTMNRSASGGILTVANGATLKIGGTNSFPTNYATHTLGATSTVEYGGTAQTVTAESYGHLTLSGSGTKTMPGSAMTIAGNFTMSGTAAATAAQALTVHGHLTLGAGTTFGAASYSHVVKQDFSNSGTFTASTSTVTLNGTSAQLISGTAATTFNALTINNAAGIVLSGVDATVGATLTFTSGLVTTGSNTLSIGAAGTASRSSGHVVGNFRKNVATGTTSRTFEVGDATNYTPVALQFPSVTTAGDLTVRTTAGDHATIATATINSTKSVNRTWTMTNSGVVFTTYNANFTFAAGDIDGGAATDSFIVGKYAAGAWTYPTVGTRTATTTQITGATSFGDFQIGEVAYALSGNVFEDVNYGGGAGRTKAAASGTSRSSARVELYTSAGVYSTSATTDVNGDYTFTDIPAGTYYVRVVNSSVTSSRTGYTAAALAVQSYRTDATTGTPVAVTDYVGGTNPSVPDPGNGSAGATFSSTTFVYSAVLSGTAQSVTPVVVSSASITGLDFGFNFNTVANTNNSGQGSLRQVIDNANLLGGDVSLAQSGLVAAKDNAVFMISNGTAAAGLRAANNYFSGGIATISPTSALPTVSTVVVLDAQKQPGWSSTPIIELNGTGAGASQNGLTVSGGGSIIRGFIINRFANHGIYLITAGADTVQGNYVGTNSAGTAASANTVHGIFVYNVASTLIGGTSATARNVVSGNNYGVVIAGAAATGNTVSGNYVGLNAAGTAALANSIGVDVEAAATGNTIGGTTTAARNVIAGNTQMGVLLQDVGTSGNTVAGNWIGINAAGSASVANGTHGVNIKNSASGNTVGGTTGTAGNVISGNTGSGIVIEGAASSGNVVQGNYVGLTPAGSASLANGGHGVYVNGAPANAIGGTTAAARNVISGNSGSGIYVFGAGATGNVVRGNYVGVSAAGTAAVANAANGVLVEAAPNDTIGGTTAGAGNVISGNTNHGVWLYGTTSAAIVQGNRIGTNAAGMAAVANVVHGVTISNGASGNTIGGTTSSARNVISGNTSAGVRLLGATTTGNVIQGNSIGVDSAGTTAIGNGAFGVIVDAVNTSVGGTAAGAGNVIAYNGSDGVAVVNTSTGNSIQRNAVYANGGLGIDLADDGVTPNNGTMNATLPNSGMDSPVFTSAVLSGTTLTLAGYVGSAASQATFAGARVEVFTSDNDASGSGEGQSYLGFFTADGSGNFSGALTVSGVSSGDKVTGTATDGSNNTSEFGANYTAGSYILSGNVYEDANYGGGAGRSRSASSGVGRSNARVELYTSAGVYSTVATTDISGNYSFTGLAAGTFYLRVVNSSVTSSRTGYTTSALAVMTFRTDATSGSAAAVTDVVGGTDPSVADPGNGSAGATFSTSTFVFSAGLSGTAQSVSKAVISTVDVTGLDFGFNFNTVVNVNNSGQGSLRQFIDNANLLAGDASLAQSGLVAAKDNAVFMISNGTSAAGLRVANNYFSGGIATISPTSALPTVSTAMVIDAQKQPGWSSAPIIELNGTGAGSSASGLTITAGSSIVRGVVINRFTGTGVAGIKLTTAGGNTIQGNYVGTNAAGTTSQANYQGIQTTTSGNTIGGSVASQRNIISGNTWRGILVDNAGGGAASNVIQGNYVGTNAAGTAAIANSIGIYLSQSPNNTIGGTGNGEGNVTSGNTNFGIYLVSAGTSGNVVQGNIIGLDKNRSGAVPNGSSGIEICCNGGGATGNTIGGTTSAAANVISGNTGRGILLWDGTGNGILGNAIYGNGGIGIDLGNDNVTPNDGAKPAATPNLQMDFPVFTSALLSGTTLTVAGYVGSAASQSLFAGARVEIFKADLDASGNGEGQAYLGFVMTDASGNISGSISVSGLSVADKITGTATDGSNNTSEFGTNVAVAAPAPSMALAETVTPSGTQLPGTDLAYTTTFTNAGTSAAHSVVITNPVPANTDFKLGSVTQNLGTTGLTVAVAYSNDGASTWTYAPVSGAGGAPAGYDRLVTHVRWTFMGTLSQTAPNNSGSTGATMRIR